MKPAPVLTAVLMDLPVRAATTRAMLAYGGTFVRRLADLLVVADTQNAASLVAAFPDVFARYGPGSAPFEAVTRGEVPA
jgi:hypothetical protein